MRKITSEIVNAFMRGDSKTMGNSSTDGDTLWLHNNAIAWRDGRNIVLTMAGWGSVTTRERLNGLLDVIAPHLAIVQRNHEQHILNRLENHSLTLLNTRDTFVIES